MSNYDDFTANDIFQKDKDHNTIYLRKDTAYIINDNLKKKRLQDLEGYRYFFQKKVSFFLSYIFVGIPLGGFIHSYYFKEINEFLIYFIIGLILHLLLLYMYNNKLTTVLKDCEIINDHSLIKEIVFNDIEKNKVKKEPFLKKVKDSTPDMNVFHIVVFLLIALPFILFVLSLIL
ncbi:hypothetical protein [Arcobacter sp. LA11]|uniref:hypothetical protein n=1 Tax=Arcobacter sp. LA11 TaxID=1898176 RepID=UPI0009323E0F|nr:hypothetical protein [Arcobacter sp. LA11]